MDFKLPEKDKVFPYLGKENYNSIDDYLALGGYVNLEKIIKQNPKDILEELKKSGLRGRGGAGFPTAIKWEAVLNYKDKSKLKYLICNADEGEPGTCKDRTIINTCVHSLIEGIIISAFCLGAKKAYIYIRGEYLKEYNVLEKAILEAKEKGFINAKTCEIIVKRGAGAYVCGEETALIESIEGKVGNPRLKPPFPAEEGLFGCPTVVNNVETLAQVGAIINKGSKWWRSLGSVGNTGSKVFTISGNVEKPTVIELQMGVPLKDLIENFAGGVTGGWGNLQAVIPGGISSGILTLEEAETAAMDFDSLYQLNAGLGTGAVIVIDKHQDLNKIILENLAFYMEESCGQCPPCREGLPWVFNKVEQIINEDNTSEYEITELMRLIDRIQSNSVCGLAPGAVKGIKNFIEKRNQFK